MAEGKERSLLFKVLYRVTSVIFFPITLVLYILKHPLWVLCVLFIIACGLVYYPMSDGVKLEEVPMWYKNKYTKVKLDVVSAAVEKGHGDMFSNDTLKDLTDEVEEQQGLKSEGYNAKVARDEAMKEKTSTLKKRGGFKRKGGDVSAEVTDEAVSGGLEAIFQSQEVERVSEEPLPVEETKKTELPQKPIEDVKMPEVQLPQAEEKNAEDDADFDDFGLF